MAKLITAYKTTDDKIFETSEEAEVYEAAAKMRVLYESDPLRNLAGDGMTVEFEDFANWINDMPSETFDALKAWCDAAIYCAQKTAYRAKARAISEEDKI